MSASLLHGKTVVLIGGAGLLGKAFGEALLRHGAELIVADLDEARCRAVCDELGIKMPGSRIVAESVDIISRDSIDALIDRVSATYDKVDTVVNNAYPRNKHYGRKLEKVE